MATMPSSEEQARLLEDALGVVRQQTAMMRRCLETNGKLMDALKCCSTLVSELRTSNLGPKQYYELYMSVFDALRHLSVYLRESHPVNHLADLYELVQYAGNIIPRLYLMITVGTAYMAIPDAPVKEIMKDMMEMSRGVQHPTRGLFLRYYISGQARDVLPSGSGDGPEGNLQDSISFVLTNFVEMNKLWVRLQHQGHSREREQRTKEREELKLLVGSNLVRLSQLVNLDMYKFSILHPLLEQVVQCRDVLAQEYLLEVITQVFPDEFHLHTLDQLLSAIARLNPHVNVKSIVIGLMDRLSTFAKQESDDRSPEERQKAESEATARLFERLKLTQNGENSEHHAESPSRDTESSKAGNIERSDGPTTNGALPNEESSVTGPVEGVSDIPEASPQINGATPARNILDEVKLFEIFHEQVMNLVSMQRLPIQDITALLVSLVNLALNINPDRLDYVDQVLSFATEKTQQFTNSADLHSQACQSSVLNLLLAPIKAYVSLFTALALPHFIPLLKAQTYPTRRALAGEISKSLIRNHTNVASVENLDSVMEILRVLIKEGSQQSGYTGGPMRRSQESEDVQEEQGWLARIVHLISGPDNETQLKLLQSAGRSLGEGNDRTKYTTPALTTCCLRLARRLKSSNGSGDAWKSQSQTLYKYTHSLISALYARASSNSNLGSSSSASIAELCLRLFLAAGQAADQGAFEEVSYEFFAQAFTVYEESISDSRAQYQAVCCISGALHNTRNFGRDNYDTLITKCALHGSKLLKKPDQCRAVCAASHLWWGTEAKGRTEDDVKELYRDGKRVLECLQRALRVADACMDAAVSVELFVEILNQYVYYFDQENEAVTTKYINGLIELIHSNLNTNEATPSMEAPKKHFQRTLDYIASRDYEGVITTAKD
ncbi:MAG: Vacuolar protein sorting-associated protein 35 [Chrysothrix sp. TS-e1954]|nr:MAG: Vacuolar protein sorting-associated protein 35 [Chrysothrix sp. TS-e1954]